MISVSCSSSRACAIDDNQSNLLSVFADMDDEGTASTACYSILSVGANLHTVL